MGGEKPSEPEKSWAERARDSAEYVGLLNPERKPKLHKKMKPWMSHWDGPFMYNGQKFWKFKRKKKKWNEKKEKMFWEPFFMYWKFQKNAEYMKDDLEKVEEKIASHTDKIKRLEEKYAGKLARLEIYAKKLRNLEAEGVQPRHMEYKLVEIRLKQLEKEAGKSGASTANGEIPDLEEEKAELEKEKDKLEENLKRSRWHMFYWKEIADKGVEKKK